MGSIKSLQLNVTGNEASRLAVVRSRIVAECSVVAHTAAGLLRATTIQRPIPRSMTQFQTQSINTSGADSQTEQPADASRQTVARQTPDVVLSATPTYDRAYDTLLTLKEATR